MCIGRFFLMCFLATIEKSVYICIMKEKKYLKKVLCCLLMGIASLQTPAQTVQGENFETATVSNGSMSMTVLNFGARIQRLKYGGQDVVLGFDTLSHYKEKKQNFGATVGRYIGRIVGGRFSLDDKEYVLQGGEKGRDCSHGGTPGFSQRFWRFVDKSDNAVTLQIVSPDGENGFPGELTLNVTYTLTDDALRIDYMATTTKPTVLNPSNHSFFNLSGVLSNNIYDHVLWIDSDSTALYNEKKQVTGKLASVDGTPFDFRTPTSIGARIDADCTQLKVTKGYDHCYRLSNSGDLQKPVARLTSPATGLAMEVYTTEPAMQIYTANSHNGSVIGKEMTPYNHRNAICFETMHFPDSPNNPQWPSTVLRPGEEFHSTTIFRFAKLQNK